jgi:hypothetical protein
MTISNMLKLIGLLAFLPVLAVGCGGGGGTTMTQSDFCTTKAKNECKGVAERCLATDSACQKARVTACEDFAAAQQAAPSTALTRPFRPDLAQACLDQATKVYAKATITPADTDALDEVCARVFSGKKKSTDADKTCHNDYECDATQICDSGFMTCAPQKSASANAGCNNPGEVCPTGQYCTGAPRQCTPRMASGQTCDINSPCLEALRCSAGTCAERVDLAEACTSNGDCLPAHPYCDTFNGNVCTNGFIPSSGSAECVAAFGAKGTSGGDGGT